MWFREPSKNTWAWLLMEHGCILHNHLMGGILLSIIFILTIHLKANDPTVGGWHTSSTLIFFPDQSMVGPAVPTQFHHLMFIKMVLLSYGMLPKSAMPFMSSEAKLSYNSNHEMREMRERWEADLGFICIFTNACTEKYSIKKDLDLQDQSKKEEDKWSKLLFLLVGQIQVSNYMQTADRPKQHGIRFGSRCGSKAGLNLRSHI